MKGVLVLLAAVLGLAGGAGLGIGMMIQFGDYHFYERPFQAGGQGSQEASVDTSETTFSPLTAPPKRDLVLLVIKLDQLQGKPAPLRLTDQQRKDLLAVLRSLDQPAEGDDPKKPLDDLLKIVADNRAALKAAGYGWPGTPNQPTGDDYRKHLQSLRDRLKK